MSAAISSTSAETFYKVALTGLRFLDQKHGRDERFGADADVRWKNFCGHLGAADRLDLLIRDAAVNWSFAFSPSKVFELAGLANDEPFGPDWPSVDDRTAARLWAVAQNTPVAPREMIQNSATILGAKSCAVHGKPGVLQATTKVAVGGLFAISQLAVEFLGRSDIRWADQVIVVADRPEERQFAGIVAVILQSSSPLQVVMPSSSSNIAAFTVRLFSEDASDVVKKTIGSRS